MTDRTVKVRLEADISDFVTDIGVKAPAAVKRLEVAASKANYRLKQTTAEVGSSVEQIGTQADAASKKVSKVGDSAKTSNSKIKASATEATRATEKLAESVGKSEKATTSAGKSFTVSSKNADNYASALGRLRVAQLHLGEAQKSGKGGAALAGAEESVAAAERAVKKFEKAGNDSGKSFTTGLRKWLTGSGGAADVGKAGGTVFGSGFLGVLKTPVLGPAVIAILGAAITTVMPAIGAVAGGAFITGFGGGLAGLGLLFAAKSDVVKAKWQTTLAQLGADMQLLAKPFESTLTNIADYFTRTVDNFNPALRKSFADLAGPVDQFASDFGRALEKLIPAIGPITTAFSAVLATLGPALSDALGNISAGLIKLSESISRSPKGLADLTTGIGDLVRQITDFITTLNDINGAFSKLTGGVSLVNVTFGILGGAVAAVAAPFELLATGIDLVNAALGKTGGGTANAGKSMQDAASKTAALAQGLGRTGTEALHAAPPVQTLAQKIAAAGGQAAYTKQQFEGYIAAMFRLQNLSLSLSNAQIGVQQAIDDAAKAAKENGRATGISTEKGRANRTALNQLADAANRQTEALQRSGKGNAAAGRAAEATRANFIKLATQMGYTVPQAKAMAASMIAIPNVLRTAKLEADKTDLDKKLAAARAALADPKLTATKRAKLEAEIKQLLAAKAQAQAAIDSLTGKTVAIRINTYKSMVETTTHVDKGVRLPAPTEPPKADGGKLGGSSPSPKADNLLFMGTAGEWVHPNDSVDYYGPGFMEAVQTKQFPKAAAKGYKDGGQIGYAGRRADGGFLPGGKLVDLAFLLRQLGIPFNPSAGVNYGSTLAAQNKANSLVRPAKAAANTAARTEAAAKADVARLQRSITLQQRYVTSLRQGGASEAKIRAEQKKTIGMQDQLYKAKLKQKAATDASNKADANYRLKADAATKATEAHKAAIEKLVEQQKAAVDMAAQISDALTSSANIGDLFQNSLTGKGLLQDLQAQGAQVGKFRGQIDQLRKQGLSEDLIQQLIGKGAEQGGEVAQAILDGGIGLVAALNKAQKALDDQANLIGAGSANKKYNQTIAGARADGGDVMAGKTYRVGERGVELFQPGVTGRIIPNQYVGGSRSTTVIEKHYHSQSNYFTGVSMAEADLIANRSLSKLRLLGVR